VREVQQRRLVRVIAEAEALPTACFETRDMTIAVIVCLAAVVAYLVGRLNASLAENVELKARIVVLKRQLARHGR
jgi:hypothetical protein